MTVIESLKSDKPAKMLEEERLIPPLKALLEALKSYFLDESTIGSLLVNLRSSPKMTPEVAAEKSTFNRDELTITVNEVMNGDYLKLDRFPAINKSIEQIIHNCFVQIVQKLELQSLSKVKVLQESFTGFILPNYNEFVRATVPNNQMVFLSSNSSNKPPEVQYRLTEAGKTFGHLLVDRWLSTMRKELSSALFNAIALIISSIPLKEKESITEARVKDFQDLAMVQDAVIRLHRLARIFPSKIFSSKRIQIRKASKSQCKDCKKELTCQVSSNTYNQQCSKCRTYIKTFILTAFSCYHGSTNYYCFTCAGLPSSLPCPTCFEKMTGSLQEGTPTQRECYQCGKMELSRWKFICPSCKLETAICKLCDPVIPSS